jgi:uncharacterized protein (DUF952 family)
MAEPSPTPNFVYKIYPNTAEFQFPVIPHPPGFILPRDQLDVASGYFHMSSATQLPGTLSFFFDSHETVKLVKVDYKRLCVDKLVKWELADDGNAYPHLYALLESQFIADVKVVEKGEGWAVTSKQLVEDKWLE